MEYFGQGYFSTLFTLIFYNIIMSDPNLLQQHQQLSHTPPSNETHPLDKLTNKGFNDALNRVISRAINACEKLGEVGINILDNLIVELQEAKARIIEKGKVKSANKQLANEVKVTEMFSGLGIKNVIQNLNNPVFKNLLEGNRCIVLGILMKNLTEEFGVSNDFFTLSMSSDNMKTRQLISTIPDGKRRILFVPEGLTVEEVLEFNRQRVIKEQKARAALREISKLDKDGLVFKKSQD